MFSFFSLPRVLLPTITAIGAAPSVTVEAPSDEAQIRKVVAEAYFDGAFNALNVDAMRKGFHPDFAILMVGKDVLARYTIAQWAAAIEERKAKPDFAIESAKRDCRIISVDATGGAAGVKVEIDKDGKLQYSDYLSLLKFEDGWKIVSKVYFEHL